MRVVRLTAAVVVTSFFWASSLWPAHAQQPVFRAGIEVIEVDVTVVDDRGRPIVDMLAPEFTVTVDGKPRRVVSSQFVSLRSAPAPFRAEKPEVFFSSNATALAGRLILIAVDRESISFGEARETMRAAGRFLGTLGPSDKVGLVTFPAGGAVVDFTANHALVRRELDRMMGVGERPRGMFNIGVSEAYAVNMHTDPQAEERVLVRICGRFRSGTGEWNECEADVRGEASTIVAEIRRQVMNSVRSLEGILEALREVEGPKSLVWISEGLPVEGLGGELIAIGRLAAAARTTVNVLMLDAPMGVANASERDQSPSEQEDRTLQMRGLEMLAGATRGVLHRVGPNPDAAFQRMEQALSGHYLLGVESLSADKDGKSHPIKVSVRRRGASVRSRQEFHVPVDAPGDGDPQQRLLRALRSPFAVTELPVRLATYAYSDPEGKVRVLVAAEVERLDRASTDLAMAFALIDREGNVAASGMERGTLLAVDGPRGPVVEHGGVLSVDPGAYTLRVAVMDAAGHRGSIEHPVQAWQMTGVPFAVGDLMLAEMAAQPGGTVRPPVEARLATGRLAAYLELYADQPEFFGNTAVTIEIASEESGPALASAEGVLRDGSGPGARVVSAVVPVSALPPGLYVARAIVMRGDQKVGQLARPFRIAAPSAASAARPTGDLSEAVADRIANPESSPSTRSTSSGRPEPVEGRVPASSVVPLSGMLAAPAAFRRNDSLEPEVVGFFLDVLARGRPALKATLTRARTGRLEGTGRAAFEAGDQLAAAFLRGLELYAKGELDQAATQFTAALSVSPDFAPASFYLGACYAAAGRDREATMAWRRATIGADTVAVEYVVLGDALIRLGESAQAVAPLREAASTWPQDDRILRRLAVVYAMTQQHKDALATIEPFLARHPEDHEALLIAVQAIYSAALQGQPLLAVTLQRERMTQYARAYAAARGPHEALVNAWLAFVTNPTDGR